MKLVRLALTSFFFSSLALSASADLPRPDPSIAEFARGVKFSVAGYDVNNPPLTNFPVLVRLANDSPSGFAYTDMMYSGAGTSDDDRDLCFLAMDGTPLAYEIDTWNPDGTSLVWVAVPVVTNNAEFVMCYRSTTEGSKALVCDANAWTNYVGVWHLGETGSGTTGRMIYDSTTNSLNGTPGPNSSRQSGAIGYAQKISTQYGKTTEQIQVNLGANSGSAKRTVVDSLVPEFSVSLWYKLASANTGDIQWLYLIGRRSDDKVAGWAIQLDDKTPDTKNNVTGTGLRILSSDAGAAKSTARPSIDPLYGTANQWIKLDVFYKQTGTTSYGYELYTNGAHCASGNFPGVPSNGRTGDHLGLGGVPVTATNKCRPLYGDLDEVRLRKGLTSAEWVAASYANEVSPAFLASGAVESFGESAMPVAVFSLNDFGAAYAKFSGSISSIGGGATSATAYLKIWPTADTEPDWTELRSGLVDLDTVTRISTGLATRTPYSYKFKITNNLDTDSEIITGTFETAEISAPGTGGGIAFFGEEVIHTFKIEEDATEFTFTPPTYVSSVRALLVGGGGPGGFDRGGGGGAGGCIYKAALGVTGGSTYVINVGTGGVASASASAYGVNGGNSSMVGDGVNLVANGGGAGGNGTADYAAGVAGGSGGGAAFKNKSEGAKTSGQGNDGGKGETDNAANYAGGGGGAGQVGGDGAAGGATSSGGIGGAGLDCDISGTSVTYAGGGAGGGTYRYSSAQKTYSKPASGGLGGGGRGGQMSDVASDAVAMSGTDGLGGGGGGGAGGENASGYEKGGNGGSGIVIIRYSMQGDGHDVYEPIISLTGATYNDTDFTADVAFRVVWAGTGRDTVNVSAIYGYSADKLVYTNANIATDVIGQGSAMVELPHVSKRVYVRLIATNAGGYTGVSSDVKNFHLFNPAAPVATVSAMPDITTAALEANVTSLGAGAQNVNGVFQICLDEFFNERTYTTFAVTDGPLSEEGILHGGATGLLANTTYWLRAVLTNNVVDAGEPTVCETEPVSFRTNLAGNPSGSIGTVSVAGTTITAQVDVASLGEGALSGTARLEASTDDFETVANQSEEIPLAAAQNGLSLEITGLQQAMTYKIRLIITNNAGRAKTVTYSTTVKTKMTSMMFLIY